MKRISNDNAGNKSCCDGDSGCRGIVSMSLAHADQPSVHITDNRNSEFVVTENNEYYVYVDGWDNTYRLIIDDVTYKLIPLW